MTGMSEGWQRRLGCDKTCGLRVVGPGSTSALAWFNNYTWVNKSTLDPSLRTWQDATQADLKSMKNVLGFQNFMPELISGGFLNKPLPTEGTVDLTRRMPWRAPGYAPLDSPCGVAGGNGRGFTALSGELFTASAQLVDLDGGLMQQTTDGGYGFGPDARIYRFRDVVETEWQRGSVVDVAWGIWANVSSQWTKNPVPVCKGPTGGDIALGCPDCSHAGGFQFPPPVPGVFGYGQCLLNGTYTMPFSIVDQLQVPLNITAGHYALSFRYDAEQTPQVWNTCASVKLL
eukprot:g150.t1